MNLSRDDCIYTSHYCEENVYKLVETIKLRDSPAEVYAIFISNRSKKVPLFFQKSGHPPEGLLVWFDRTFWVYDLDTTLEFPCEVTRYWSKAIRPNSVFGQDFERYFRVVDGSMYLRHFASNRSHMHNVDGWLAPPPTYGAISTPEATHNLPRYIDFPLPTECLDSCVDEQLKLLPFGLVLTENAFYSFFTTNY
ncbi:Protein N-terminal glutamine amidohydrolase [Echinococcus granulosus]|uniref:Protein N-terminal glutamine amidohydrolase n=1 Tax=Echinococcus granulosus TaxID=6210 RepID=A0A068WI67_ECHGR|nr:Protein N-terminal glutamine amidohydrolase [Echinococcus granulosus]CDS17370.1 protein N terminal glutamine [Echinococcus granulosus]